MEGLNGLGWEIHDHLKEFRPKMFQELKASGRLNKSVKQMQDQAIARMASLENAGLYHHEAWEIVKDDVLLPAEEDLPNLGETRQPFNELETPSLPERTSSSMPTTPSLKGKRLSIEPTSPRSNSSSPSKLTVV